MSGSVRTPVRWRRSFGRRRESLVIAVRGDVRHIVFVFAVPIGAAWLIAFAPVAAAQETVNNASVAGRVTDETGAVVVGADVTARQTETNVTAATKTGGDGRFRFPYLKVGPYEIVVRQAGFADATRRLNVTVGGA